MKRTLFALLALAATTASVGAGTVPRGTLWTPPAPRAEPARMTCKAASSCRDAVELWCGGYYGADRDNDGIPCESVCHSREQVQQIEAEIGCDL